MVLLEGSEGTWPMEQTTLEKTWAWVSQVDLFWTNIDGEITNLGFHNYS